MRERSWRCGPPRIGPMARASRLRRWRSLRRAGAARGVSEIVATILILLLTVSLFTVVFLALRLFPHPSTPAVGQFSATLNYTRGSTVIRAVSITHLAGPTVSGATASQAGIYIASQSKGATYGPFLLAQGLGGSTTWSYGQTWTCTSACPSFPVLTAPDNITVSVFGQNQILFQASLAAVNPGFAPYFVKAYVTPKTGMNFSSASPVAYWVNASIICNTACANPAVTVDYSEFAGNGTTPANLRCSPVSAPVENCTLLSTWISLTTKSPSSPGTYFIFLVAKDSTGRTDTIPITVTVG